MILPENLDSSEEALFFTERGNLYLKQANGITIKIDLPYLLGIEQKVTACTQLKDNHPGFIMLSFSVSDKGKNELYVSNSLDINKVMNNKRLDINNLRKVFVSNVLIIKLSMYSEGIFISSDNGELHYCQIVKSAAEEFTFIKTNNVNINHRGLTANAVASAVSGPFDEIIAAKDGFAIFITNLLTYVPRIVEAVENKVIKEGKELFDKLGNEIKTHQQKVEGAFNKPLSYFLQQHSDHNTAVNTSNINRSVSAFFSSSSTFSNTNNGDSNQMRRFLFEKLNLTKGLDGFSTRAIPSSVSVLNFVQPTAVTTNDQRGDDAVEQLGLLFEKFYSLLDVTKADNLINIDFNKLLDCISGDKPFSTILNDCFNAFKIDDAMNAFFDVLSKGSIYSMLDQMKLVDSLKEKIDNGFFETLYKHYFPDQEFNILELTAFVISILAYVIFAAQGKTKAFSDLFANKDYVQYFVGIPENLVKGLGGSINNNRLRSRAVALEVGVEAPEWLQEMSAGLFSVVLTLWIGVNGVFNFGTGAIASPLTGGFAASIGLCLGGGAHRNFDFTQWKEVVSDLAAGFIGGFAGALVGGGITRMMAYFWAKNGQPPDDRLRKLQLSGIGSSLLFGGGGGAITAVIIKNLIIKGKVDFNDFDWNWVVLTAGAVGGIGGGFMGSGSHFAPPITSGTCLPVPVTFAETQTLGFTQPVINAMAYLNASTPLPPLNFPPFVAAGPNPAFMGVYKTELDFGGGITRRSIALVKNQEFTEMDNNYSPPGGIDRRERLFWLYPGGPPPNLNIPPEMDGIADLVIGIHGVGRYVFPCMSYMTGGATTADFSRVMTADDFAEFLANDVWITNFLTNIRNGIGQPARSPIIKLSICFSALPPGCCSIGRILARRLNATTYAGRPGVLPWLRNQQPVVPSSGSFLEKILLTRTWNPEWIKYTP